MYEGTISDPKSYFFCLVTLLAICVKDNSLLVDFKHWPNAHNWASQLQSVESYARAIGGYRI
jgi:hypothetical protein